jgi:hypothetical protein
MKKFPGLLIILLVLLLSYSSCKETGNETDYNPNVISSRDLIYAEDLIFEVINIYFQGITDTGVMLEEYNYLQGCSIEYFQESDSMHFHYGPVNRMCPDNKYRRGSIISKLNGPIFTVGSSVNMVMDSLFIDDDLFEGTMTSEFLGINQDGLQEFTFTLDSGKVTLHDTAAILSSIRFNCDYILTWQEGGNTPYVHEDDMLQATGTTSGKNVDNIDFQSTIQEPLVDDFSCFWIVSGTHQLITPSAQITTGTIDYISTDLCNYQVDFFFGESHFYDDLKH